MQGAKNEEARPMLADIYGWFAEGFETADLKDAKGLLDELAARPNRLKTSGQHSSPGFSSCQARGD